MSRALNRVHYLDSETGQWLPVDIPVQENYVPSIHDPIPHNYQQLIAFGSLPKNGIAVKSWNPMASIFPTLDQFMK